MKTKKEVKITYDKEFYLALVVTLLLELLTMIGNVFLLQKKYILVWFIGVICLTSGYATIFLINHKYFILMKERRIRNEN